MGKIKRTSDIVVQVVAGNASQLAQNISQYLDVPLVQAQITAFSDTESKILLPASHNKDADVQVLVHSAEKPINESLMQMFFLINALKQKNNLIIVVAPYFGYSRQNKLYDNSSYSLSVVIALIEAMPIYSFLTCDVHDINTVQFSVQNKLHHISYAQLFVEFFLAQNDLQNQILVSPDQGSMLRVQEMANILQCPWIGMTKARLKNGTCLIQNACTEQLKHHKYTIIDDIIDTGNTLCETAHVLKQHGAQNIDAIVSHGVFSAGALSLIKEAPIDKLVTTNSLHQKSDPKVQYYDISCIIAKRLMDIITRIS